MYKLCKCRIDGRVVVVSSYFEVIILTCQVSHGHLSVSQNFDLTHCYDTVSQNHEIVPRIFNLIGQNLRILKYAIVIFDVLAITSF